VIIMIIIAVVAHIITRYTPFGLHVYSTGGNEETTRLAGISPDRIKMAVYMISGFLAALGGILLTARLCVVQWSQLDGCTFLLPASDQRPGINPGCYRGPDQQAPALKYPSRSKTFT
jgi:ribose/xylose/arabinose/galactoside ABC-type transport system permease subunit